MMDSGRMKFTIILSVLLISMGLLTPADAHGYTRNVYYSGYLNAYDGRASANHSINGSRMLAGGGGINVTAVAQEYTSTGVFYGQAEATGAAAQFSHPQSNYGYARCYYRSAGTGTNVTCSYLTP